MGFKSPEKTAQFDEKIRACIRQILAEQEVKNRDQLVLSAMKRGSQLLDKWKYKKGTGAKR